MLALPQPLHPALVHFPIVLVLLGAGVAVAAFFTRRWNLPVIAAVLLSLGAIGALLAFATGEREGEMVSEAGALERVIEQHENWAEATRLFASAAAVLAISTLLTGRWVPVSRVIAAAAASVAIAAAWCVFQTGHYGGQLVYRHGAGVMVAAAGNNQQAPAPAPADRRRRNDDD